MEISISPELEEYVASKVASGRYGSVEEMVIAGIESLRSEEQIIEQWLLDEVIPAYDEMQAHPERGIPIDEVFENLRELHEKRLKMLV